MTKHEELRQRLLLDIERMPAHTALATEREIAAAYDVSRNTVRQALDSLATSGTVYRVQGAGTFVASHAVHKSLTLTSFSEDMHARGLRPSSHVLTAERTRAGPQVASQLDLAADDEVFRVARLRLADESPMCLENVHLSVHRVPHLLEHDLSTSLYELLHRHYQLELCRADQVVRAVDLDDTEAALLSVSTGSSGLRVIRTGMDHRERPVEATVTTYRADRYDMRFTVRRTQ